MTIFASTARKATAALLAAAVVGATLAPAAAEAKSGRTALAIGAGLAGGLLLGAIASDSAYAYDREIAYERDCWLEKRKRYNAYGEPYFVRVRVCD